MLSDALPAGLDLHAVPQGGALALKVYVHPMAEGLARTGAHLDQVVGL